MTEHVPQSEPGEDPLRIPRRFDRLNQKKEPAEDEVEGTDSEAPLDPIEASEEEGTPAPDLEAEPDGPDDLGEIEGWLKGQDNIRRLGTHVWGVARSDLPNSPAIVVFEHSPKVKPPS